MFTQSPAAVRMRVLVSRKTEHFRAGIKYSKAATFQSCSAFAPGGV